MHTTPEPKYNPQEVLSVSPASHANKLRDDIETAIRVEFQILDAGAPAEQWAPPARPANPRVSDRASFSRSVSLFFEGDAGQPITSRGKTGVVRSIEITYSYSFYDGTWKWDISGSWDRPLKSGKSTEDRLHYRSTEAGGLDDVPWLQELVRLHMPQTAITFTET